MTVLVNTLLLLFHFLTSHSVFTPPRLIHAPFNFFLPISSLAHLAIHISLYCARVSSEAWRRWQVGRRTLKKEEGERTRHQEEPPLFLETRTRKDQLSCAAVGPLRRPRLRYVQFIHW